MAFSTILVAINALDEEHLVLKKAFALAEAIDAKIKIIHVNDTDAGKVHMMMDYFPKATIEDLKERIKQCGFEDKIPTIEFVVVENDSPINGIIKEADKKDLLVMGHHKKNVFLDIFRKGTDELVSNKVKCPLLLIPLD